MSPDGKSVYVTNAAGNTVSQYTAGTGGALAPKSPVTVVTGAVPLGVTVSPDGSSVYVANQGSDTVSQYSVDAGTGALSAKNPATVRAGTEPTGVALSPHGHSVFVTNLADGTVSQYDVGAGGTLSPKNPPTVAASLFPFAIAVSPDIPPRAGRAIRVGRTGARVGPRGVVVVRVRCPTAQDRCRVRVALRRLGSAAVIGRGRASIDGGTGTGVRVKVTRRALRALARRGRLKVRVAVRALHAAGNRSRRTMTVTLRAPAKRPGRIRGAID